jgi:hypothetical protein
MGWTTTLDQTAAMPDHQLQAPPGFVGLGLDEVGGHIAPSRRRRGFLS